MNLPPRQRLPTAGGMKGYGQFGRRAIAAETPAERWPALILRQLLAGSHRFNDIRHGVPLISRSLLAQRLRELEDAGVVESQPMASGRGRMYQLTKAGQHLHTVIDGLGEWGKRWG